MSTDKQAQPVWVYHGPDRSYAWPPMVVRDGEILAWPEVPAADGCWSEAPPGSEPTHGPDLPGSHRIWSEEELTHLPFPALKEDWEPVEQPAPEQFEVPAGDEQKEEVDVDA